MSIQHFDADPTAITGVTFDDRAMKRLDQGAASSGLTDGDDSNTFRTMGLGGSPMLVIAHCTDKSGNQYEVELMVKLGI